MSNSRTCPNCGKPLPADGPEGMCPECLLRAALPRQSTFDGGTALHTADGLSATAIAPEAGVRLKYFGDYELLEEIARGGMGVVWKARQASLNRHVAVKMIRAGALAGAAEIERFMREAEAAANLQHPNIVAIHEVGEYDGQHYFSMDFVAGRDLGVLAAEGPLPPMRAAQYIKTIAAAIQFAHQRGILHRDLKPQNVLIDANDQPRITDFGLAKFMTADSGLTQPGVVMGSPSYMPPEQAAGRQADIGPASDVYALGAMLYELLTGRPPFRGVTPLATLREVMEGEPTPPRRLAAAIPPDLETICLKCLEKAPTARYPTAQALADELDRYLKGEPIQARPATTLRRTVSWARRHPGMLAALAALVMIGLAFGVFYLLEENAFLRARQLNPRLVREPGQLRESLQVWSTINSFAVVAGLWLFVLVSARARGLTLKQMYDPTTYFRPMQPLGERVRVGVACAGVLLAGCGVALLLMTIQAHIWEGSPLLQDVAQIYASTYFGLAAIALAIRDYRRMHFGMPSRQLTAAQIEPIRRAMENFDVPAAVRSYRSAAPDASLAEAREFALRLAETLRGEHPGKYVLPALTLSTLNWPLMFICATIEAVSFAIFFLMMPPSHPAAFVARFVFSLLFGAGLMAGLRVKGFWRRILLLVPAFVVMGLVQAFIPEANNGAQLTGATYIFGTIFGIMLMMSGFTPRRHSGV